VTTTTRNYRTLPQVLEERPWLSERYLRRLVYERKIPFSKLDGRLLFDLADIDDYVERHRVEVVSK
jgi:hypothetical protein